MTLGKRQRDVTESYADPEMASKYLFGRGEVYEFAAVFLLLNKAFSPAFQLGGQHSWITS
jgi:hypothetical protein